MFEKRAGDEHAVAALRHEADVLAVASHPGVVELREFSANGDTATLATTRVAGTTLAILNPPHAEAVRILAAIAQTIADLHSMGIVHGGLGPDHVIVTDDGRPVLCGLGRGGSPGSSPPGTAQPLDTGDDLRALGALLDQYATGADRGARIASLRAQLSDDVPPPAAEIAGRLADLALSPSSPQVGPPPRPSRPRPRPPAAQRSPWPAIAAVGVAGLVVVGGIAFMLGRPSRSAPLATTAAVVQTTASPTTVGAELVQALPAAPSTTLAPSTSTTATTQPPRAPAEIEWQGARFRLGAVGDIVTFGDWNCDGVPTPALLDVVTNDVFVFSRWATVAETAVTVRAAAHVPGAVSLRVDDVDGCDELHAITDTDAIAVFPSVEEP